jgi:protein TonB
MQQPEHDLRPFQASAASPRRYISFAVVAALHIVVIYALAAGLAAKVIAKLPTELKAEVVQQKPPEQEKTPPPPPPDMAKPPPPFVPPPDISIQSNAPATNAISNVQSKRAAPPPRVVPPRPAGRQTVPTYPPISRRLGEQGTVLLRITVSANGDVVAAKVEKSSGYSRLDRAALEWVRRRHYHPATQGGRAIAAQTLIRYTFNLRG